MLPQQPIQADFAIDLGHAFHVSLCRADGAEDDVHFLESETFGFRDVEPDECGAEEGQAAEEEVGAVGYGGDHVGCYLFGKMEVSLVFVLMDLGLEKEKDWGKG